MLSDNKLLGLTSLCAPSRREAGHTRAVEGVAFQKGQDAPKQSPFCLCKCREDVHVDPEEMSSETGVPFFLHHSESSTCPQRVLCRAQMEMGLITLMLLLSEEQWPLVHRRLPSPTLG